jgi:hypothetical protein
MPKRYVGNLIIDIKFNSFTGDYEGYIKTKNWKWKFTELRSPICWTNFSFYGSKAYDTMTKKLLYFASNYTSDNKIDIEDIPDWAPMPEIADEIQSEILQNTDENGQIIISYNSTC